uniref:alternative oxidase, mitochondrial-like isoform X1 n=1 Tax=Styela clava TaxID=7725 RepID=UPI00193AA493|nr:alternative oxidase, mitochondrial-like isoform X1 [Styela clava]
MESFARLCLRNNKATLLLTRCQCRNFVSSPNVMTQLPKELGFVKFSAFANVPQQVRQISTDKSRLLTISNDQKEKENVNNNENEQIINEESLPHFRERHQQEKKATESGAGGMTPVSKDIAHPDIEEALGMHEGGYRLPHPVWSTEELESVRITHKPPVTRVDKLAYFTVSTLRKGFDLFSGYTWGKYRGTLHEKQWLKRIIFLETVAGVPGMVGAMVRHLDSLRKIKRDHGWIHTLLEEAENERMHLMTALRVAHPGILMRLTIALAQGMFVPSFSIAYLISPAFCHRFVGYLEEEAVKTYTTCLQAIDEGELKMWCRMKAPEIAIEYWKLPQDAMMRDVILAIRADEAHHRTVNHTLGSKKGDEKNPYKPGE